MDNRTSHDVPDTNIQTNLENAESQIASYIPQIFTEPEAAKWLKVSRITLQRIRLRGEIAFSRIGGTRVIYTAQHLSDFLKSREKAAFRSC